MIDLKRSYMYTMYEIEVVVYNYSVYTMFIIRYIFSEVHVIYNNILIIDELGRVCTISSLKDMQNNMLAN